MEDNRNKTYDLLSNVQNFLSLGYLFLLVLGLIREAVFYGFIGINILTYSGITDALMSPLALITESIIIPVTLIGIGIFFWSRIHYGPKLVEKYKHKKWFNRLCNVEKIERNRKQNDGPSGQISLILMALVFFYLGTGIGSGIKAKSLLSQDEVEINAKLVFISGEQEKVRILGQNGTYVFYLEDGTDGVVIAPILANIRKIERIKSKD